MTSLFLWTAVVMAGEPSAAEVPYPHARTGRNVGIVVTAPGIVLGGLGAGLMVSGATARPCRGDLDPPPDCGWGTAFQIFFGGVSVAAATPFLGVGIPLWARGNRRLRKNELALGALPRQGGATVQLALRW